MYYRELKRQLRKTDVLQSHTLETGAQEIAALNSDQPSSHARFRSPRCARACNRRGSEPPGPATACPVTRERDFPSDHLMGYVLQLHLRNRKAVPCIP
jgi:hypothetical protein